MLIIIDLIKGTEKSIVKDAHKDIIKRVYCFEDGTKLITGSIDGTLAVRSVNDIENVI